MTNEQLARVAPSTVRRAREDGQGADGAAQLFTYMPACSLRLPSYCDCQIQWLGCCILTR